MNYKNIIRAITEMAYDNGAVSRYSTIESIVQKTMYVLRLWLSITALQKVESELSQINDYEMKQLCAGDDFEQQAIMDRWEVDSSTALVLKIIWDYGIGG